MLQIHFGEELSSKQVEMGLIYLHFCYLYTSYFLLSNRGTNRTVIERPRSESVCFVHQKMSTKDMNEINGKDDDLQEEIL